MKKILSAFIILTMLFTPVFAENDAIMVSGGEIKTGEEITVVISVPNVPAAIGSITLSYDNMCLEPIKSEFSTEFKATSPLINLKYNKNQIKFNWITLSGGIDFKDCVSITFKGIAGGKSRVEVIKADIYDINETKIDITSVSEEINVIGEPPIEDEFDDASDEEGDELNSGGGDGGSSGSKNNGTSRPSGTISDNGSSTENKPSNNDTQEKENNKKRFEDIDDVLWAKESIEFLAEKGIINGVSETEFAPQNNIKRADYLLLLIKMLGIEEEFEDNFDDVSSDKYYYNAVGIAKKLKLASGVGANKFNPEKTITRQEMFVIAYRVLKMKNIELENEQVSVLEGFTDYNMIAEYALPTLAVMVKNKLISGSNGNIMPLGTATRAETAVIVKRLYDMIGG